MKPVQFSLYPFALLTAAIVMSGASCQPRTPAEVELRYTRSGGMLGYNDVLTLFDDGRIEIIRNGKSRMATLSEPDRITLRTLLEATSGLAKMQPAKPSEGPIRAGADYLTYTLTYGDNAVSTDDLRMTEEAKPVITLLNRVIEDNANELGPAAARE